MKLDPGHGRRGCTRRGGRRRAGRARRRPSCSETPLRSRRAPARAATSREEVPVVVPSRFQPRPRASRGSSRERSRGRRAARPRARGCRRSAIVRVEVAGDAPRPGQPDRRPARVHLGLAGARRGAEAAVAVLRPSSTRIAAFGASARAFVRRGGEHHERPEQRRRRVSPWPGRGAPGDLEPRPVAGAARARAPGPKARQNSVVADRVREVEGQRGDEERPELPSSVWSPEYVTHIRDVHERAEEVARRRADPGGEPEAAELAAQDARECLAPSSPRPPSPPSATASTGPARRRGWRRARRWRQPQAGRAAQHVAGQQHDVGRRLDVGQRREGDPAERGQRGERGHEREHARARMASARTSSKPTARRAPSSRNEATIQLRDHLRDSGRPGRSSAAPPEGSRAAPPRIRAVCVAKYQPPASTSARRRVGDRAAVAEQHGARREPRRRTPRRASRS